MIGSSKIGLRPIRGGGGGDVYTPFFDKFANGLEGWSLDRLVTGYSAPILTIVRPSDSATQDIYLDGNSIDTAAILAFVGSENAQVKNIYGQLGNYNLEQLTLASQPLIARAGVILLDGGKPTIEFDGVNDGLIVSSGYTVALSTISTLSVSRGLDIDTNKVRFLISEASGNAIYFDWASGSNTRMFGGSSVLYTFAQNLNRELMDYFVGAANASQFGIDGVNVGSVGNQSGTYNNLVVGAYLAGFNTKMNFQELILFDNADRTGERTAMRTDINDRYTIY
jgi:hypothetical protein